MFKGKNTENIYTRTKNNQAWKMIKKYFTIISRIQNRFVYTHSNRLAGEKEFNL